MKIVEDSNRKFGAAAGTQLARRELVLYVSGSNFDVLTSYGDDDDDYYCSFRSPEPEKKKKGEFR